MKAARIAAWRSAAGKQKGKPPCGVTSRTVWLRTTQLYQNLGAAEAGCPKDSLRLAERWPPQDRAGQPKDNLERAQLEAFFLNTILATVGRSERRSTARCMCKGCCWTGNVSQLSLSPGVCGRQRPGLTTIRGTRPWAWETVRRLLAQHLEEALLPAAGWIVEDTGLAKQGKESVGVARQYSGALGKVGNCQVAVGVHLGPPKREVRRWTGRFIFLSLGRRMGSVAARRGFPTPRPSGPRSSWRWIICRLGPAGAG